MGELILFQTLAGARPGALGDVPSPACTGPGAVQSASVGLRERSGGRRAAGAPAREGGRSAARWARSERRPAFFFDLACPFSYVAADQIERLLGDVEWVPVPGQALAEGQPERDQDKIIVQATCLARAARLPLVLPDRFPAPVPGALRVAAYASEIGAGARFGLAAGRLAFCGGFDLERRSVLEDVAMAAGLSVEECLVAAAEEWRDPELRATASFLESKGLLELPVVSICGQWFQGAQALSQAVSWRRSA